LIWRTADKQRRCIPTGSGRATVAGNRDSSARRTEFNELGGENKTRSVVLPHENGNQNPEIPVVSAESEAFRVSLFCVRPSNLKSGFVTGRNAPWSPCLACVDKSCSGLEFSNCRV